MLSVLTTVEFLSSLWWEINKRDVFIEYKSAMDVIVIYSLSTDDSHWNSANAVLCVKHLRIKETGLHTNSKIIQINQSSPN